MSHIRIRYKGVLMFLQIVFLMPPKGIYVLMPQIGKIWNICGYSVVALVALSVVYYCFKRLKRDLAAIYIFFITIVVITILQNADIKQCVTNYLYIVAWLSFFYLNLDRIDELVVYLRKYLSVLVVLNFILVLTFRNGMYVSMGHGYTQNWLLGYKNSLQEYALPLFFLTLMEINKARKSKYLWMIIAICIAESILTGAVTLTVVLILSLVLYIASVRLNKLALSPYFLVGLVVGVNVLFVGGFFLSLKYLNAFMSNVLNKTTTLGGRIPIWSKTIEMISRSPIIGHGTVSEDTRMLLTRFQHAHNNYLEMLYQGGIVWFIMFLVICIYTCNCLSKYANTTRGTTLVICFFAILLFATFEPLTHKFDCILWIMIALGSNGQLLESSNNNVCIPDVRRISLTQRN